MVATRRIFPVLVPVTLSLALLAGFVVTLADQEDFPSFGLGVWWAIVTLATRWIWKRGAHHDLGAGRRKCDHRRRRHFPLFLTATVTSLVSREQDEKAAEEAERRAASEAETRALIAASEAETRALFRRLDERLGAIDAKLDR